MSRFDVILDRDMIVDNLTKREYDLNNDVNFCLWEIISDLSNYINNLAEENGQLRKEKIEANAFIVENGLAEEFVKWTTCIVGENDE